MAKKRFGMMSLTIAAAGFAIAAQAGVQEGVEAWRTGDYARAVAEWQPLADQGDPDAQFNLGQAYKLGRGVPQDMASGTAAIRSAPRTQGHLQAEANYGLMLFQDGNRRAGDALYHTRRQSRRGAGAIYLWNRASFNGDLAPARLAARLCDDDQCAARAGLPQANASLEQMDRYIPIEDRQRGTEMAAQTGSSG